MKSKKKNSFRSSMVRNLKWFTENISALHGVNQLANKSGKALVLWALVIVGNIMLTGSFILIAKQKYNDDSMVTQMNAECNVSQVPFPSVSICNFNLISLRESRAINELLKRHDIPQTEIDGFFHGLQFLISYGVNSTEIGNYTKIMNILKSHYYFMDSIMDEVHQKCERLLLYCSFNRKEKNCSEIFQMIKTFQGHCCAFNYGGSNDETDFTFTEDEDFEYYVEEDEDDDGVTSIMTHKLIVTTEFGSMSGLFVVFDVEPDDYPPYTVSPNYGAKILISDPYDYPETSTKYHLMTTGETVNFKVDPQFYQGDNALRKVNPSKRNCWFHDEVHLTYTDRYSYETCNTECKMKLFLDKCGCVPYKYPQEKSRRVCELADLKCLHNVKVRTSELEMNCTPICYVECSDKKYSTTEDTNTILSEKLPEHIKRNHQVEQLSALHVYYRSLDADCYQMTLLIDINNFVATYGGVFSLSFGASIITIVEILYLSIRFIIITLSYFVGKSRVNNADFRNE